MKSPPLLALLLAVFSPLAAQGYYPLEVGNQWDYGELDYPGQFTYLYSVFIVDDTLMPNGHSYAIQKSIYGTHYLRQFGSQVFAYTSGKDTVVYDFSFEDGDTVAIYPVFSDTIVVTVRVGMGDFFGRFLKSWTYVTQPKVNPEGSRITITDSLGYSHAFIDPGYTEYLIGARINGIVYGTITSVPAENFPLHEDFRLFPNFPNPFNAMTTIQYYVRTRSSVEIALYSLVGQRVRVLSSGVVDVGTHRLRFDSSELSSGIYFLRLQSDRVCITRPIVLIK